MRLNEGQAREPGSRGFTLVEVLLVCLILAVLAALLFPVLTQAQKQARMAVCTSHLRQLGIAYRLYADDEEKYPNPVRLARSLARSPAGQRLLFCPEDRGETRAASSYVFRGALPPDFQPYWTRPDLDPRTVLAICNHHLEQPTGRRGKTRTVGTPRYPFELVLRAGGSVERIHADRVREMIVPGDRPEYIRIYPGEPGYDRAMR